MPSEQLTDNYPSLRDITETERLHVQHDLVVNALGGLVICPVDLDKEDVRILDIGTADGWWLKQLRKELKHPHSATLIGSDIAPYPGIRENVILHNFKTPFPEDWKNNFDLIQLRAVLANVPGDASIDLLKRTIELLKVGGYIQLVDSALPSGELHDKMKPSEEFFTRLGNHLVSNGLKADQGARAAESLRSASDGRLENIETKEATLILGKASKTEETDFAWLRGMGDVVGRALISGKSMAEEDFGRLRLALFEEARREGISFLWYAAWAKRTSSG